MTTASTTSEARAMQKALQLGLAQRVRRVCFGVYVVPSTSEQDVTWTVTVENNDAYTCTCRAAHLAACVHRAAVWLRKAEAAGLRVLAVKGAADRRRVTGLAAAHAGEEAPAPVSANVTPLRRAA